MNIDGNATISAEHVVSQSNSADLSESKSTEEGNPHLPISPNSFRIWKLLDKVSQQNELRKEKIDWMQRSSTGALFGNNVIKMLKILSFFSVEIITVHIPMPQSWHGMARFFLPMPQKWQLQHRKNKRN